MPQTGQGPGRSCKTSGCMGQVHRGASGVAAWSGGSSAIPHLGQLAGPGLFTPGHMGHQYSPAVAGGVGGGVAGCTRGGAAAFIIRKGES